MRYYEVMLRFLLFFFLIPCVGKAQSAEPAVLSLLNHVRTRPQQFLKEQVEPYLDKNQLTRNSYAKSLVKELKATKKMQALQLSKPLTEVARIHAMDMGKKGLTGHDSSNGTPFHERVRKHSKAKGMIAENCSYGYDQALDIVMSLLIDDGIKSLGHRKNILEPKYKWVGIAIEPHQTYQINCVMDFAESF